MFQMQKKWILMISQDFQQAIESLIVNLEQRLSTKENRHKCKIITLTTQHHIMVSPIYPIEYQENILRLVKEYVYLMQILKGDLHKLFDIQKMSQKISKITIENMDKLKHENVTVIQKYQV